MEIVIFLKDKLKDNFNYIISNNKKIKEKIIKKDGYLFYISTLDMKSYQQVLMFVT